jgi:glycosyltransferase involved in cell wall biosynthesis
MEERLLRGIAKRNRKRFMKLLICTQKLDPQDPVLGFFARWVEEFEKYAEVEIITRADLGNGNRISRAARFLKLLQGREYDAVFVHMNPEYLVVAGWLWKLQGKKVALWYTHKSVDLKLRIAEKFADVVFTASKESFRLRSSKVKVMGHGIDVDFFSPDPNVSREAWALSVGRLSKSKRHDLAIRMAKEDGRELRIAGEGHERFHLEAFAHELGARVFFLGPLTQAQLREEYRKAAVLYHTSETGSLDKVVLEALACGLPVKTRDQALQFLEHEGREYVRANHSLSALIPRIVEALK